VSGCADNGLLLAAAGCLLLAGCGSGAAGGDRNGQMAAACDPAVEFCGSVPLSVNACSDSAFWPLTLQSGQRPLTVHYSRLGERAKAAEVLAAIEQSWTVQVDQLGFAAPLDDGGACGADGRYDVFLWAGVDGAYVEAVADNPRTPYNDYSTYMAIDPNGAYGGDLMDTTLAHEFNHAVQASDDWWENPLIFEMTATFAEGLVYPGRSDYFFTIRDFQARPDWSVFYDDAYQTWHMYGAAMFLHFLHQRYFAADRGFIARIWHAMRSDPQADRPDYIDALTAILLNERGVTLNDAMVEFMQWRWFVAGFDDGMHFEQGADWPAPVSYLQANAADASIALDLDAMHYGAAYLLLQNNGDGERRFTVDFAADDLLTAWRLTTAAGDDAKAGIDVPPQASVVLVATALPAEPLSAAALAFDTHTAKLRLTARQVSAPLL